MKCKTVVFSFVYTVCFLLFMKTSCLAQYQFFIQPSISLSQEYTDNLYLTEDNEESEWITLVSPQLDVSLTGKASEMSLSYSPEFSFYNEYSEYDSTRHNLSFNAWKQITKNWRLSVADKFYRTEEPYDVYRLTTPAEEEEFIEWYDYTIRQNREPHYANNAWVKAEYMFGRKDSFFMIYNNRIFRDDNPGAEDSERHRGSLGLDYWFLTHLGLEFRSEYTRGEFDKNTDDFDMWQGSLRLIRNFSRFWDGFVDYTHNYVDFEGETEDYNVYVPSIGTTYRFAEDAYLTVAGGYYFQDKDGGEEESGPIFTVDLGKSWRFKKGFFRLNGGSGYDMTYFGSENLGFTEYYEAVGTFNYSFTRRLSGDLALNYRYNRYIDQDPDRKDHVGTISAAINYQLKKWLVVSLNERYRVVDSDVELKDYQENRVMLTLSIIPDQIKLN